MPGTPSRALQLPPARGAMPTGPGLDQALKMPLARRSRIGSTVGETRGRRGRAAGSAHRYLTPLLRPLLSAWPLGDGGGGRAPLHLGRPKGFPASSDLQASRAVPPRASCVPAPRAPLCASSPVRPGMCARPRTAHQCDRALVHRIRACSHSCARQAPAASRLRAAMAAGVTCFGGLGPPQAQWLRWAGAQAVPAPRWPSA